MLLEHWLAEPLLEAHFSESRVPGRNQRALAKFNPEIPRARVNDNLAGIVARGEALTDQLVETELLRARHFNSAIHRRAHGDPADCLDDVISRHGLNEYGRQPNHRSVSSVIGNALDELEELR